jgi:hypothetical protein
MAESLPRHVALVSEINQSKLSSSELTTVSAAISKQVARDFGPIWGINATVDVFTSLDDVPPGYWPVVVEEDIGDPSAAGFHTDKDGNPMALVQFSSSWSLTVSHETLEMLADPSGNRVVASVSPADDKSRVEILVEVCDPSEDVAFSYSIDGVTVSDFYTPRYFDADAASDARYSFTGSIKKPRQVLKGGYISFHDLVSDHWKQITFFGAKPKTVDLGVMGVKSGESIREQVDRKTLVIPFVKGFPRSGEVLSQTRSLGKGVTASSNAKARAWRSLIKDLKGKK